MNSDQQQSERPINILVIDDEPIFRLGFSSALEEYSDLQVIAQADTVAAALAFLAQQLPNLIVVADSGVALTLMRELPWESDLNVPIFLLSTPLNPQQLRTAQSLGIQGYCPRGIAVSELAIALRQVASGGTYWKSAISPVSQPLRQQSWLVSTGQSGLQQIDSSLAEVERHLRNPQLPLFDWLFWSGRKRELLSARWIVSQFLPELIIPKERAERLVFVPPDSQLAIYSGGERLAQRGTALDNTLEKIQLGVNNLTGVPLEIDILQPQRKQELLYLIVSQFREILAELRFLQVAPEQLSERVVLIVRELWQTSTVNFLSKNCPSIIEGRLDLMSILLREAVLVQREIFDKIPWTVELVGYFLFQEPLSIERVSYRYGSPEAVERAEFILQNLIIQVANGVMQVTLNHFSEAEDVQNLYRDRFISSREIAKFRNDLSWRYRREKYFAAPTDIFESRYRLLYLSGRGIKKTSFYAPRQDELNQLRGIPWVVTIALETRDAIAPRLQAVVDFVGRGLIYVLTEVIGKGIGLVGRGVILGIGNVLQESRYRKNSERGKQ